MREFGHPVPDGSDGNQLVEIVEIVEAR